MDGRPCKGAKTVVEDLSEHWDEFTYLANTNSPEDISLEKIEDIEEFNNTPLVESSEKGGGRLTDSGKELLTIVQLLTTWTEENTSQEPEIMIIEDDSTMAQMFERWLENSFKAKMASSSDYMSEIDKSVDVIVVERFLDNTDSTEVINNIRDNWPEKPILLLVGVDPEIEDIDPEADDHIVKPVSRMEFIKKIRSLVQG